jgi:hypothetical protein
LVTATLRGAGSAKTIPGRVGACCAGREDLTAEKFIDLWKRLIDLGQEREEILAAWIAKEELRALLAMARTSTSRRQISHRLWTFYQCVRLQRHPRTAPTRRDHPGMVAAGRGIDPHRHHQRRPQGRQPADRT